MALYTILFGLSIFMIALLLAIIKRMFFHWKEEHKIETMNVIRSDRPAICVMLYTDKCVMRRRRYPHSIVFYDLLSKSDISLLKKESNTSITNQADSSRSDLTYTSQTDMVNALKASRPKSSADLTDASKNNLTINSNSKQINSNSKQINSNSKQINSNSKQTNSNPKQINSNSKQTNNVADKDGDS